MNIHHTRSPHKGFTLVETLVAITVLLLVVIGPITIAQKGIQNAYYANEQVTAVYLAQEAIEAIREYRDATGLELLNGQSVDSWNEWYNDSTLIHGDCKTTSGCAYDVIDNRFESCELNNVCQLRENSEGEYSYAIDGTSVNSPFTRKVYIDGSPSGGGVQVTVDVTWNTQIYSGERRVRLQTWVYDVYEWLE